MYDTMNGNLEVLKLVKQTVVEIQATKLKEIVRLAMEELDVVDILTKPSTEIAKEVLKKMGMDEMSPIRRVTNHYQRTD